MYIYIYIYEYMQMQAKSKPRLGKGKGKGKARAKPRQCKYKAKPTKKRVWLVTIEMPRQLMQSNSVEKVQFADNEIDLEDVQKAEDENLDSEEALVNANK